MEEATQFEVATLPETASLFEAASSSEAASSFAAALQFEKNLTLSLPHLRPLYAPRGNSVLALHIRQGN